MRQPFNPELPLGKFLLYEWRQSGLTITAYSKSIGIGRTVLARLMRDHLPRDVTYRKLRGTFGDELPPSDTEDERRRTWGIEEGQHYLHLAKTPKALRKLRDSLKGVPKSAEHVRKVQEAQIASGARDRFVAAGKAYSASQRGRAERSIGNYLLRWNHEPDEATLAGWAAEVAANISMTPEMVRAIWTDYMADRGLLKGSEKYQRHLLICAFRNQAPRRWKAVTEKFPYFSDTRAAHGMWHRAHPSVPPCGVKKA